MSGHSKNAVGLFKLFGPKIGVKVEPASSDAGIFGTDGTFGSGGSKRRVEDEPHGPVGKQRVAPPVETPAPATESPVAPVPSTKKKAAAKKTAPIAPVAPSAKKKQKAAASPVVAPAASEPMAPSATVAPPAATQKAAASPVAAPAPSAKKKQKVVQAACVEETEGWTSDAINSAWARYTTPLRNII